MRTFRNGFNILEIVKVNRCEEYLYMTQEELFQKKLNTDAEILKWKDSVEKTKSIIEIDGFEYSFPDPFFMYSINLIKSAIISVLIDYKFSNLERLKNLSDKLEEYEKIVTELLINSIKNNPKISYIELINLGNEEDEFEMYLEKLIEDKVISRRGKANDMYWKVR